MKPKNQLSSDQFLKLVGDNKDAKGKQNKHRNTIVMDPDHGKFDSKGELRRYKELLILQRAGQIDRLERQTAFLLIPKSDKFRKIVYNADFTYYENDHFIVEDFKNPYNRKKDKAYRLKKIMMYHFHGIEIKETM